MKQPRATIEAEGECFVETDDGSLTLRSRRFGETYHSESGAVAESRHVFVQLSGAAKWRQMAQPESAALRILEIGFGTGLNFLLTTDARRAPASRLVYHAVEFEPLSVAAFRRLHFENYLAETSWIDHVAELLESVERDSRRQIHTLRHGETELRIYCENALRIPFPRCYYDVVYLDAFSPRSNPTLWQVGFLRRLRHSLRERGCLVTYCVQRQVKDALTAAGFSVMKYRGPRGGKREVLRAFPGHLLGYE